MMLIWKMLNLTNKHYQSSSKFIHLHYSFAIGVWAARKISWPCARLSLNYKNAQFSARAELHRLSDGLEKKKKSLAKRSNRNVIRCAQKLMTDAHQIVQRCEKMQKISFQRLSILSLLARTFPIHLRLPLLLRCVTLSRLFCVSWSFLSFFCHIHLNAPWPTRAGQHIITRLRALKKNITRLTFLILLRNDKVVTDPFTRTHTRNITGEKDETYTK